MDFISIAIQGTASYNSKNTAPEYISKGDPNQNFDELHILIVGKAMDLY